MKTMTKKERIDAALRGEPVDRIPVSLWRHFYQYEDTARGLADAMLLFQQDYDWDFMKDQPKGKLSH
jgi:uroporphyrinogen decarboxylase